MGVSCVVLGASGYTGGELLRLLAAHPALDLQAAAGDRSTGWSIADVHPHLRSESPVVSVEEAITQGADVFFSCLPHGAGKEVIGGLDCDLIVDLSEDHRHEPGWVYGLPELDRHRNATRVANPGCYPTACLLALAPFAAEGAIAGSIAIDALSGYSGAGRATEDRLLFSSADGGVGAYGSIPHRHVSEIEKGLASLGGLDAIVSFTPHLVPMSRGVLVTARAQLTAPMKEAGAIALLKECYADEPFITVSDEWPSTKAVLASNTALLSAHVDERANFLICSAAIDNLGKGAAGQAIQNANLALGLDETLGLATIGVWP